MTNLNDLTLDGLAREMESFGVPKYRAEQMFQWFSRGVTDFDGMSDLPKDLRGKLAREFGTASVTIEERFVSALDGTKKYLLRLNDGGLIESVAMTYRHGISVCLSTQAGCRMGCKFCASALGGKVRDLTAGEILGQAAALQRDLGERISNIVLMGIGEPLDNYENVVTFLRNVSHAKGMNIGCRHISLSTCGIADKIYALAKEHMPVTLSVSLHAPDDGTRSEIMPVNKRYSVGELIAA
ncbi:MAG: radical SAM protein, partial [Clostridiales bacterium]|nr:radical SAM protein [Clostridiales bacterium]